MVVQAISHLQNTPKSLRQINMKGKFGYQKDSSTSGSKPASKGKTKMNEIKTRSSAKKTTQMGSTSAPNESKNKSNKKAVKQSSAKQPTATITPIKDVTPMLKNMTIKGRVISVWHGHRQNQQHDPYSLECVLQDEHGDRIQVYVKKEWMFQFEPLLRDGVCYLISNFGVAENGGKLPLLPHAWKISFYKNTNVTRIEQIDDNINGFISEPFSRILDTEVEYADKDAVDVIGTVVGISDVVAVNSIGSKKIRRTVVLENEEGERLDLTFWDAWAKKWDEYAAKRDTIGHIDVMLILGKVKIFHDIPAVHNALFGTKMFINRDWPQFVEFRKRYENRDDYDANEHKIQAIANESRVISPENFMNGAVKKLVGSIRDTEPDTDCVIYATVHSIQYESGWEYIGCRECSRKVEPVESQVPTASKNKATWWCTKHKLQTQVSSRFKMIIRVIDDSGTAQLCIFDGSVHKMSGYTAWELVEKYGKDTKTYFPHDELDGIIGKSFLFRIKYSEYNHVNNSHVYRCEKVATDEETLSFWRNGFVEDQDDDADSDADSEDDKDSENDDGSEHTIEPDSGDDMDGEMTTPAIPIKKSKVLDLSLTRRLQLETPSSCTGSSGSGSGKKRPRTIEKSVIVINLSDSEYDTEDDENQPGAKKTMVSMEQDANGDKPIVTVKQEKDVDVADQMDGASK